MLQSPRALQLAVATLVLSFVAGCAEQATAPASPPTHDAATSGPELAGAWYQIYFDTGSIAINARGQMIVKNVAYVVANGGPARVTGSAERTVSALRPTIWLCRTDGRTRSAMRSSPPECRPLSSIRAGSARGR